MGLDTLTREGTPYARGSSFNALVQILQNAGIAVDKGGAGVGWVRFAAQPLADDTLTINGRVYCFDPTGGAPAYDVAVTIGAAVTNTIDNLLAEINADADTRCHAAKGAGAVVCMLQSTDTGPTSNFALAESTAGVRMILSAAAAVGGEAKNAIPTIRKATYEVTAADVASLAIPAELPVATFPGTVAPTVIVVGVVTSAGVVVPLTVAITLVWRQFNSGFWTLCIQDSAAVLTAADVVSVLVIS